jgi:response regulator NasT
MVMGIIHKPPYLPGEIRTTSLLAVKKYQEAERLRAELQSKERLLEERKAVEKAKGLLMQDLRLSETEAYHRLRKLAMDRREPLFQMASAVLLAYQLREEGTLSLF